MNAAAKRSDYDYGWDEGYETGQSDGYSDGYAKGVDDGIEQGQRSLEGELWKLLYEVRDFMQSIPIEHTDRYRRLNRDVQVFLEDHK